MIKIGLTSWSEHGDLLNKPKISLAEYASKLPVVEVDTFFYGIPRVSTVRQWVKETPEQFTFVIKAHQAMTKHSNWKMYDESEEDMHRTYMSAIQPLVDSHKLQAILLQFSSEFTCTSEHVAYLRKIRKIYTHYPLAIEFRHPSWFSEEYLSSMLSFMEREEFILVVADEPQVAKLSVPFYPVITNQQQVVLRCHGRNQQGWQTKGENWRKERTLYRYSKEELIEIGKVVKRLAKQVADVTIIFNNNSGGDAAKNSLELKELLDIGYDGLNPEQMNLF